MTDTTPLHRLADHWRELADEYDDEAHLALHRCADQLAGSLAAIDVEAAAEDVLDHLIARSTNDTYTSEEFYADRRTIIARLQSAFAAGQAQGIAKCPVSGKHEWRQTHRYKDNTPPIALDTCFGCGVERSAVEKPTPDSPEEAK